MPFTIDLARGRAVIRAAAFYYAIGGQYGVVFTAGHLTRRMTARSFRTLGGYRD